VELTPAFDGKSPDVEIEDASDSQKLMMKKTAQL